MVNGFFIELIEVLNVMLILDVIFSYPGDTDADDYIERFPAPMPIQITLDLTGIRSPKQSYKYISY